MMKNITDEKVDYYCECCFAPVTPTSINTTHKCDPVIKARREAERDAANKVINEIDDPVCDNPCGPSDTLITNSPMLFNDNYRLCKIHGCTDSDCYCKR